MVPLHFAPELISHILYMLQWCDPTKYRSHVVKCAMVSKAWNRVAVTILWDTIDISTTVYYHQNKRHPLPLRLLKRLHEPLHNMAYGMPWDRRCIRRVNLSLNTTVPAARRYLQEHGKLLLELLVQTRPLSLGIDIVAAKDSPFEAVAEFLQSLKQLPMLQQLSLGTDLRQLPIPLYEAVYDVVCNYWQLRSLDLSRLRDIHCDEVHGFLASQPHLKVLIAPPEFHGPLPSLLDSMDSLSMLKRFHCDLSFQYRIHPYDINNSMTQLVSNHPRIESLQLDVRNGFGRAELSLSALAQLGHLKHLVLKLFDLDFYAPKPATLFRSLVSLQLESQDALSLGLVGWLAELDWPKLQYVEMWNAEMDCHVLASWLNHAPHLLRFQLDLYALILTSTTVTAVRDVRVCCQYVHESQQSVYMTRRPSYLWMDVAQSGYLNCRG
jgi:hypothetical protein